MFSLRCAIALAAVVCAASCAPPDEDTPRGEGEGEAGEGEGEVGEGEGEVGEGEGEGGEGEGEACTADVDCADDNECTVDRCVNGFCANAASPDGAVCGAGCEDEACQGGVCRSGQIINPDRDEDGEYEVRCGGSDCNDINNAINLAGSENCNDLVDNDCDGAVDRRDTECSTSVVCDGGGCWENPLPHGRGLSAVWPFAANDIAFTSGGLVTRINASGITASLIGASGPVRSTVWGSATNTLYAVADGIYRSEDAVTFTRIPGSEALNGPMWGFADDDLVAAPFFGSDIFHYDGTTWSPLPSGFGDAIVASIHGVASNDIWAVAGNNTAHLVSHFDGTSWTATNLGSFGSVLNAVFAIDTDDVWAVGDFNFAWHFDGAAWAQVPFAQGAVFTDIWGAASDDVWAVATGQFPLMHWDGAQWSGTEVPARTLTAVEGRAADDVWAVGAAGAIHFDGTSWQAPTTYNADELQAVDAELVDGAVVAVAVGLGPTGQTVLRRNETDGVVSWDVDERFPELFVGRAAVDVHAADDVWVTAFSAELGHVAVHDDGVTWSVVPSTAQLSDVCTTDDGRVYGAADGRIMTLVDGVIDLDIVVQPTDRPGELLDHVFCFGNDVWASGAAGVLHNVDGRWRQYEIQSLIDADRSSGNSADNLWVVNQGLQAVSHFDGARWERIALPAINSALPTDVSTSPQGKAWITGTVGYLAIADDSGVERIDTGLTGNLRFPFAVSDDDVLFLEFAGPTTTVWRRTAGVQTAVVVETTARLVELSFVSPTFAAGVDVNSQVWFFDGATFSPAPASPFVNPRTLVALAPNDVWVTANSNSIFHFDGTAWTTQQLGNDFAATPVDSYGTTNNIWVAMNNGVVLRGGVDGFVTATTTTERTVSRLAGTGTDDVWLFGSVGGRSVPRQVVSTGTGNVEFKAPGAMVQVQKVNDRVLMVGRDHSVWADTTLGFLQLTPAPAPSGDLKSAVFFAEDDAVGGFGGSNERYDGTSWVRNFESFSNDVGGTANAAFAVGSVGRIQRLERR
jgi:hypothetical protein